MTAPQQIDLDEAVARSHGWHLLPDYLAARAARTMRALISRDEQRAAGLSLPRHVAVSGDVAGLRASLCSPRACAAGVEIPGRLAPLEARAEGRGWPEVGCAPWAANPDDPCECEAEAE